MMSDIRTCKVERLADLVGSPPGAEVEIIQDALTGILHKIELIGCHKI